jgi:penicillin amidase
MRMIVDMSDLDRSLVIQTTGQSGHAYHSHYIDQADSWRKIEYQPFLWTRSAVEQQLADTLRLMVLEERGRPARK